MSSRVENRTLAAVVLVYVTRMLGLFMILPVLVINQEQYAGANSFLIGVALGAYGLAQAIFQVPLGRLSDRIGRKPVILGGLALFALGSLVAALASTVWLLIVGRIIQGAGAISAALLALLSENSREQNRSRLMAVLGISIGLSFGLAMILGPLLAARWGMQSIFLLCVLLAVIGAVAISRIPQQHAIETGISGQLADESLAKSELRRLNLGIFSLHAVQMSLWLVVPVSLLEIYRVEESSHWVWYLVAVGGGFLAMAPFMQLMARRNRYKTTLLAGVVALLAAQFGLHQSLPFAGFVLALVVFFWGFNLLEATLPSLVSKWVAETRRGRAMGWYSASQFGGTFAGGALGGWIYSQWGEQGLSVFAIALLSVWLMVGIGMRPLPRLQSFVIQPLPVDRLGELLQCDGILSVIQYESDGESLVRVDMERVASDTLEKFGLN